VAADLLDEVLAGEPRFEEQVGEGTYADKIGPADRDLDPERPADELERTVRALHPHIGARLRLEDDSVLGVHRAALLQEGEPGAPDRGLFAREGRLLLACSPGVLELLEVQPPGARAMEAAAYLRGHAAPGRR
jgi:methionyl-tRNA formyltransferase